MLKIRKEATEYIQCQTAFKVKEIRLAVGSDFKVEATAKKKSWQMTTSQLNTS
jgi:hypothetical protein